ncbi:MAG: hypothetical protein ACRDJ3_04995 [Solirubrobacteraceae bacterium]
MLTTPIELDAASVDPDRDVDVLGVYTAGGYIALAAGGFGLLMALSEDLPRLPRSLGVAATLATTAFGARHILEPVEVAAVLRRRLSPPVLPLLGMFALAVSGAERSPMFYPSLVLTGFGGGRLGRVRLNRAKPNTSALFAGAATAVYPAVVVGVRRLRREALDARLLWNVGVSPLFFAFAAIGGELGDLALAVRRIERTRKRDKDALKPSASGNRAPIFHIAGDIRGTAAELEQALLRIAAPRRSLEDPSSREVQAAVEDIRGEIQHHQLAPLLVAAANERQLPLVPTLTAVLDIYREGWREQSISIRFHPQILAGKSIHPRVTSALVRATKVALDNSYRHQRRTLTAIELHLAHDDSGYLTLRIRDDAGGSSPPEAGEWGTGLSETRAHVHSLGGTVSLLASGGGVELVVRVPSQPPVSDSLDGHVQLSGRIDDSLLRCARAIRPATWVNGVACCLTAPNRRSGAAHAALFSALVIADRSWNRRRRGDPWRARSIVSAMSMLWPAGGRPTTGWTGLEIVSLGAFGRAREAFGVGTLALALTSLSAYRVKHTIERARLVENVAFPLVCAASGVAAAYGRRLLQDAERDSICLRERAELVELLARTVRLHHDLIKPLRRSRAWYEEGIMASADGQRLLELSGRIDTLTRRLLALIVMADPIADLREHLQLRLAPTVVTVGGTRPLWTSRRADAVGVERAREHLALVALADELADHVLDRFPPTITGTPRPELLHVDISPLDDRELRLSLQPHPSQAQGERRSPALEAAVARLSGRIISRRRQDMLTLALPATALTAL